MMILDTYIAALEKIAGQAPVKEPRDYPTVGWTGRQTDAGDAFNEAVQQAFNEGYARACWELGLMADAALETEAAQ